MDTRTYKFNNSEVKIIFGNILDSTAEVIVSSDDTSLSMSGGISKAILAAGGETVQIDAQKKLPVNIGDVVVSSAGQLKQKYIFHCMSIDKNVRFEIYEGTRITTTDVNKYIVGHSVEQCFELLNVLNISSIAFPVIGTGAAHIPFKEAVETMAEYISSMLCSTSKSYHVEIYVFPRKDKHDQDADPIFMIEKFAAAEALAKFNALQKRRNIKQKDERPDIESLKIPERDKMDHDVFISYSRKDKEKAQELCTFLHANKIKYWIDEEGVFSSYDFKSVIVDAIDASKIVLFLSSANSNSSENVYREIGVAADAKRPIIPVMFDDAPLSNNIRYDISNIDRIDYTYPEEGQKKLLASIIYRLGLNKA